MINDETNFSYQNYYCQIRQYSVLTSGTAHDSQFNTYAGRAYPHFNTRTTLYDKSYFTTRVLPSIESLSYNQGSPDGGHVITVTGYSWLLDKSKVSFKIHGVDNAADYTTCALQTLTKDESDKFTATCKTAATPVSPDTVKYFKGAHGWKLEIWDGVTTWSPSGNPTLTNVMFNAELGYNDYTTNGYSKYTSKGTTMFCPPVSAEYYFWLMSDDQSKLYLHPTADEIPTGDQAINFASSDTVLTND